MIKKATAAREIEARLAEYERKLRAESIPGVERENELQCV